MTQPSHPDDFELAARLLRGEVRALETLYERYADCVFAFVRHQLGGANADVEDVWQETWLAAIGALPRYRGESTLFTWLCAIARRKVADRHRRRGERVSADDPAVEANVASLIDRDPLPDAVLEQRAVKLAVVEALASMSDEYRRVLVTRYAEDRSVEDTAATIGRSYKATESLLSRARAALREALSARAMSHSRENRHG